MSIQQNPVDVEGEGCTFSDDVWHVARLKPHGFETATRNLTRQGFATFMPMREATVRHARRRRVVRRPLFPGYVFVGFDPGVTQWRAINSTFGVSGLVMASAHVLRRAPNGLVEALREGCDESGLILPPMVLLPGQRVRVLHGPFSNFIAEVEKLSDGARVHLLLDLMGRRTRAICARQDLEIAASG